MMTSSAAARMGVGLVAGLAGVGAGHLVAAFIEPESAPVLAVAAGVVDLTPQGVKQWAISTFGSGDKIFLIAVVLAVAIAACVIAGLTSRRTARTGSWIFAVLGIICAVAAWTRPVATFLSGVPSAVMLTVAIVVLRALVDRRTRGGDSQGEEQQLARRSFLRLAGAATILGAAGLTVGQWAISAAQRAATIALPKPTKPLPPLPEGLDIKGISAMQTPLADFYRVDTALTVPAIDPGDWRLEIDGDVDHPMTLTFEDLLKYEVIERDITMACVSNPTGGPYIGGARWLGVRTSDVLAAAGVRDTADQILSTDVDGMTISTPVQALLDDREALLAFGINGEQLPREHGFPVRLVTPGLFGYVGSTKWVTRLTATTYAKQQAYWTIHGWVIDGTVLTGSRIDVPASDASLTVGKPTNVAGVAWAQGRGITGVEVRVDQEPWQPATLGPDAGIDYWRQWYFEWTPTKGSHSLQVRAIDSTGAPQTGDDREPYPGGATGWDLIAVTAH